MKSIRSTMMSWKTNLMVFLLGVVGCYSVGVAHAQTPTPDDTGDKWHVIERIGNGFVAGEERLGEKFPDPKRNLSKKEQLENFDILWEAIDRHYSFFELKKIDWKKIKKLYRQRVKAAKSDDEFYRVLFDLVQELKDSHCYIKNYRVDLPGCSPCVGTHRIEGKAVVTSVAKDSEAYTKGLRPGAVITRIDGMSVAQKVEQLRPLIRIRSSEHAFLESAYRRLLTGECGTTVRVTFVPPGYHKSVTISLQRNGGIPWGEPWKYRNMSFHVEKWEHLWVGTHPAGYGYIRIVTFRGREEIADEFDRALERHKDLPGLIIDIRDNPGGFGTSQRRIIGRLIAARTKVALLFRKSGPGHQDFKQGDIFFAPSGDWQYDKPIVLLTNAITGSASDLFTCQMRGAGRVVTMGTTTHGNLPGHSVSVALPCGLVVCISNTYVADINGVPIELNGNKPDIHAELTIRDVIDETDSVLEKAVDLLDKATLWTDSGGSIRQSPGVSRKR